MAGQKTKTIRAFLKEKKAKDRQMYVEHVREASPSSVLVVKYWLLRTRMLRKLRTQLMFYIKQQLETECQFCGSLYGLQVELLESLEDVFYDFLRESGQTLSKYAWHEWFFYVKRNTSYRTLCTDCHDQLVENYQMERKKVRRAEKIEQRLLKEKQEFDNMTEADKAKWK